MKKSKNKERKYSVNFKVLKVVCLVCFYVGFQTYIIAQASLAAEDKVEDITVTTKHGEQRIYSLYRDSQTPEQWYYMPNRVRIAEKKDKDGNTRPKMTILKYQYSDKTGELQEGGVLSATFTMAMEPEVVDDVKSQLLARVNNLDNSKDAFFKKYQKKMVKSKIRLAGLPLESSTIEFLNGDGEFIGKTTATPAFKGATTVSQEMAISYKLTALGASIINALASGQSGLSLRITITYKGLSAPCGYKITGKWNNVYSHYEKQTQKEGGFSYGPIQSICRIIQRNETRKSKKNPRC